MQDLPDDTIETLEDLRAFERLENPDFETQTKLLTGVKGHLADFPLKFFNKERVKDAPALNPDGLIPTDVFL